MERLLEMGLNPDIFNHDGETAMMLAAIHGHDSVKPPPSQRQALHPKD